jgi:hypothetical protein
MAQTCLSPGFLAGVAVNEAPLRAMDRAPAAASSKQPAEEPGYRLGRNRLQLSDRMPRVLSLQWMSGGFLSAPWTALAKSGRDIWSCSLNNQAPW